MIGSNFSFSNEDNKYIFNSSSELNEQGSFEGVSSDNILDNHPNNDHKKEKNIKIFFKIKKKEEKENNQTKYYWVNNKENTLSINCNNNIKKENGDGTIEKFKFEKIFSMEEENKKIF